MKGRKPTPTVLRVLRGNPGRRPLNAHEPQVPALAEGIPAELSDAVAREEWTRVIVPAIERGLITEADRVFAVAHCELWATWREQLALAATGAHVIRAGVNGYPMPNPARIMANKTLLLLAKVDVELGFSPSARSRVTVTGKEQKSKVDLFKAQKRA